MSSYQTTLPAVRSEEVLSSNRNSSRPSFEFQSYSMPMGVERPEDTPKSFFGRKGKKSKRHIGKFSFSGLNHSLAGIDELEGKGERTSDSDEVVDPHVARKRQISEPYNFHHITHTFAGSFPELDRASPNDLATEFSAVRASQASQPGLKGIKAEDLHFKNFSSEALCPSTPGTASGSSPSSPLASPHRSAEKHSRTGSKVDGSPSTSAHARIASGSLSQSSDGSILAPPRISSRAAVTLAYDGPSPLQRSPTTRRHPKQSRSRDLMTPSPFPNLDPEFQTDQTTMPHAVTTPDDTAWPLKPPTPTEDLDLDQSAREDMVSPLPTDTRRYSRMIQPRHRGPRQTQSLSDIKRSSRHIPTQKAGTNCRMERSPSQGSDTLGGLAPSDRPATSLGGLIGGTSKRTSMGLGAVEGCWEDDIDYCYEHAAEADCNYEWDRYSDTDQASLHGAQEDQPDEKSPAEGPEAEKDEATPHLTRASLHLATNLDVPDLSPSAAKSSSTFASEATTPSHLLPPVDASQGLPRISSTGSFEEADGFTLSPSLLIPRDYATQIMREDIYDSYLGDSSEPKDRSYTMFDHVLELSESGTESYGSSSTPLSKCNSQESFNFPRAQRHRSANSGGSLPDLVHSGNSADNPRREQFDAAAQQLAEHIASLNLVDGSQHHAQQRHVSSSSSSSSASHHYHQPPHRRNQSLAKEVARQSVLLKTSSNGSLSDMTRAAAYPSSASQARAAADPSALPNRSRSGSSGSSVYSSGTRRTSRASYTLFPI
ncbi:MAG: hypothetical protein M4579_000257 [Chaenotheca gracillima]|nr:MAG: hypothetical protein M4579_000257 [Chaenotheca gracillima]